MYPTALSLQRGMFLATEYTNEKTMGCQFSYGFLTSGQTNNRKYLVAKECPLLNRYKNNL